MAEKPVFARLPGDVVGMAPYRAENALLQMFLLRGDRQRQQDYCDLALNHPANGAVSYRVTSDMVLVTALYVGAMRSLDPIDGPKGKICEWDIAFWSPVTGGPTHGAHTSGWLPSFMFVDTAAAMASGREIFGYPKSHGVIARDGVNARDARVRVSTLQFATFGPEHEPREAPILAIESDGAALSDEAPADADAWTDVGFKNLALAADRGPPSPFTMPQITLRQARDPLNLGRATQQTILETAPGEITDMAFGFLQGSHTVRLHEAASHPIARTLGLKPRNTPVLGSGVWMRFNFTIGASRAIWQSS